MNEQFSEIYNEFLNYGFKSMRNAWLLKEKNLNKFLNTSKKENKLKDGEEPFRKPVANVSESSDDSKESCIKAGNLDILEISFEFDDEDTNKMMEETNIGDSKEDEDSNDTKIMNML